jgi:hypothetical protein
MFGAEKTRKNNQIVKESLAYWSTCFLFYGWRQPKSMEYSRLTGYGHVAKIFLAMNSLA